MHRLLTLIAILSFTSALAQNPVVSIDTELGSIEVELYMDQAPITANNFLVYAKIGAFDTIASFYRVVTKDNQAGSPVKISVLQGGFGSDEAIEQNQLGYIDHENTTVTGIKHKDGVISMARNAPGTASSEFFICVGDQPSLDHKGKRNPDGQGFAAFGQVIRGMDVVRQIHAMANTDQMLDRPMKIIAIRQIR